MNLEKEYGEVINGPETYKDVADEIKSGGSCLIGWTDELGTHFDILILTSPTHLGGNLQRGIKEDDIFIAIVGLGAFGFKINDNKKYANYIDEKFGNRIGRATSEKLSDLLNNIITELLEQ